MYRLHYNIAAADCECDSIRLKMVKHVSRHGMSKARRHHLVPRFYLSRFANPKGHISVFDRTTRSSFGTSVDNVAVEAGFYEVLDNDGNRSEIAEETLSKVESCASDIVLRLVQDQSSLRTEERINLSLFMALQLTRTRQFRETMSTVSGVFTKLDFWMNSYGLDREGMRSYIKRTSKQEPTDEFVEALIEGRDRLSDIRIEPSQNERVSQALTTAVELAPRLAKRPWILLKSSERSFLTSDQPIALWRDEATDEGIYGLGVATADEIYCPIDPLHVLVLGIGELGTFGSADANSRDVKNVNAIVANNAYRMVFHHPKHKPLSGIQLPREVTRLTINGVAVQRERDTWSALQEQLLPMAEALRERRRK